MPAVRRLLGHCVIEEAQRRRVCHRNRKQHVIPRGAVCLVIRDPVTGGSKNYCGACALAILDLAADDLQALRDAFA